MLSFSLLSNGLDILCWLRSLVVGCYVWLHYFLKMSLKWYLATSILEIGTFHATCHSPVNDICFRMQEKLVSNNKKEATRKLYPV